MSSIMLIVPPPDVRIFPSYGILHSTFKYNSHLWMSALMKEASLHPLTWQPDLPRMVSILNDYEHEWRAGWWGAQVKSTSAYRPSLKGKLQLKLYPQFFSLNILLGVTTRYQSMFPSTQVEMHPRKTFLILSLSLFKILLFFLFFIPPPTCMKLLSYSQRAKQSKDVPHPPPPTSRLAGDMCRHILVKTWGQMSLITQTSHQNRSFTP